MAQFTTRIELHSATWDDYVELHEAMTKQGFSHIIQSGDGISYELPPAEYNLTGPLTRSQVLDRAKIAANSVGRKYGIVVTESAGRTWCGLQSVR